MCDACKELEQAVEAMGEATNVRELQAILSTMLNRGVDVPTELIRFVNRMASYETVLLANPDADPDEKQRLLMEITLDMDGGHLDQEFAQHRATGYELIDIAGTIAVVEDDSIRCWMQVGMAVVAKVTNPVTAIAILCALLVEFGRQPELVAEIRSANQRYHGA